MGYTADVFLAANEVVFLLSAEAHKALELLENYRRKLPPENKELREALARAIIAIRSRLFQALLGMYITSSHLPKGKSTCIPIEPTSE